jgi:preprotein translocase subunit YajC
MVSGKRTIDFFVIGDIFFKEDNTKITFLKGSFMQRFMIVMAVFSNAAGVFAQTGAAPQGKGIMDPSFIFMMVVMFAIIYFLMLRPQQKKQKETQNMLNNIKKGDKVLTIAGIIGIVGNVKDSTVMVKVAENTVLEFKKAAISAVLNDEKPSADDKNSKKDVKA